LLVALTFLFAFLWSVKNGQYQDTFTPSVRVLFDDSDPEKNKKVNQNNISKNNQLNNNQPQS